MKTISKLSLALVFALASLNTYAIDGEIDMIQPKIFLFATKDDYKDGSLRKFVNDYKE